jgi:hypothetical protein
MHIIPGSIGAYSHSKLRIGLPSEVIEAVRLDHYNSHLTYLKATQQPSSELLVFWVGTSLTDLVRTMSLLASALES